MCFKFKNWFNKKEKKELSQKFVYNAGRVPEIDNYGDFRNCFDEPDYARFILAQLAVEINGCKEVPGFVMIGYRFDADAMFEYVDEEDREINGGVWHVCHYKFNGTIS